jgi:hypothetical protein
MNHSENTRRRSRSKPIDSSDSEEVEEKINNDKKSRSAHKNNS